MAEPEAEKSQRPPRHLRWWPGILLVVVALVAIVWIRLQADWPFQQRNLTTAKLVIITVILIGVWWTFFSRAPWHLRLGVILGLVCLFAVGAALFRLRGVSGDLVPIPEFRWSKRSLPTTTPGPITLYAPTCTSRPSSAPESINACGCIIQTSR